jgi:hypothetical protein
MKKDRQQQSMELILCALISAGLSYNVSAGYDMKSPWQENTIAAAGIALAVSFVLSACYHRKKGVLISACVSVAAILAEVVILFTSGAFSGGTAIDNNPNLFAIIAISASILVFWLTRRRAAIAVLFLGGTFLTAAFDLLKYPVSLYGYLIFLFGLFLLLPFRIYRRSMLQGDLPKGRLQARILQPVAISLLVMLLSSGIYYGIVKPMSPPVDERKLTQRLMSMEVMEKLGIATKTIIYTDQPVILDDPLMRQDQEQLKDREQEKDQKNLNHDGRLGNGSKLVSAVAITYKKAVHMLWIAAPAILLLLALAILGKLVLRKRWYHGLLKKSREEAVLILYAYFLKKLKKAGYRRAKDLTLLEYAVGSNEILSRFSVYDADFLKLTQIYQKILYGYHRISEQELDLFLDFYKEFFKNLKKEMGTLKFCLQFLFSA